MAIDTQLIIQNLPDVEVEVGKYGYDKKELVELIERCQNTVFGTNQYPQTTSVNIFAFVAKNSGKGVKKDKGILRIKCNFNNYGLRSLSVTLIHILKFLNAGGTPHKWPKSVDAENFEFVRDHYVINTKYSWVQDIINFNKQIQ